MKRFCQISALAASLLLGGPNAVMTAQDEGGPRTLVSTFITYGSPEYLIVQTQAGAQATSSNAYAVLVGSPVTIPAGQTGYLVATFSGESLCTGTSGAWCTLKVVAVNGGGEMNPVVGNDFAFDSVGSDQYESHSIERISNELSAGYYVVQVHWAVFGIATFRIDDWLFKVEFWRKS